jgi:hypothetical protein
VDLAQNLADFAVDYTQTKVFLLKAPDSIIENQGNQPRKS